nr:cob(I)yrinic acid a,c-diamide adenosyltransferase [uncultured Psychrobacter sp.]
MSNRLTKIYTRTGDNGSTGMADGSRMSKADALFGVMGDIDELNSHIGLARAQLAQMQDKLPERLDEQKDMDFAQALVIVQHLLFNIGGELAMPEYQGISGAHVEWLEQQIDTMNSTLPPLKDFILPTGSVLVSQLHVARTVCRRAERQAVMLRELRPQAMSHSAVSLVNRLSDWLFVAARFCTDSSQVSEVLWNPQVLQAFDDLQK